MPTVFELTTDLHERIFIKTDQDQLDNTQARDIMLNTISANEAVAARINIKKIKPVKGRVAEKHDRRLTVPCRTESGVVYYKHAGQTKPIAIIDNPGRNGKQTIYHATVPKEIERQHTRAAIEEYLAYVVQEYNRLCPDKPVHNPQWTNVIKLPRKFLKPYGVDIQELGDNLMLTMSSKDIVEPGDILKDESGEIYICIGYYEGKANTTGPSPEAGWMYIYIGGNTYLSTDDVQHGQFDECFRDIITETLKEPGLDGNSLYKAKPMKFHKKLGSIDLEPIMDKLQTVFGAARVT